MRVIPETNLISTFLLTWVKRDDSKLQMLVFVYLFKENTE